MARLLSAELSVDEILAEFDEATDGAVVLFIGKARSSSAEAREPVRALEYEAYEEMAEPMLETIEKEVAIAERATKVRILHRVGRVPVGGVTVLVAASAPHRKAAITATRAAVERLKRDVPIWKKEILARGERWVVPSPLVREA